MSHRDLNPVHRGRPKRAAVVISNSAVSTTTGWPVGFWWSELTHPYHKLSEAGWELDVFSPDGGRCEADALSDPEDPSGWSADDAISRGYKHDPAFMRLVEDTRSVDEIDVDAYDVLVVTGGQGPMFTFDGAVSLQQRFLEFLDRGKIAAALCHGVSLLRHLRLPSGDALVEGRTVTGFANVEEDFSDEASWNSGALARGTHVMPWRIEDELRRLGANYVNAGLWRPFAIRDGNLITGQQNYSGSAVADEILTAVGR